MLAKRRPLLWIVLLVIATLAVIFGKAIFLDLRDIWRGSTVVGTGHFEVSPDGRYEAHAMNMRQEVDGQEVAYYEFTIIRKSDGTVIAEHRIDDDLQGVEFSDGNGTITWQSDNTAVHFGTKETTVWNYVLAKNKQGEQVEAGS